jgi:hypothetical protein
MYLEEPADKAVGKAAVPLSHIGRKTLIPAIVCAGVSVILMRADFLTFFFLVPLGVCAVVFGPAAAWLGAVFAALGNGVWSVGLPHAGLDTLYFAVLALGFTWIMAGKEPWFHPPRPVIPPVRTAFRFIAASVAGALVFLAVIFSIGDDENFSAALRSQIEAIASSYIAASGTDAAQRAYLEQTLTADRIIDLFSMIILRGGALFSAAFLLFFNRQAAFILARLFRRKGGNVSSDLIGFHVPRRVIWVLSLCLPVILLCRTASLGMVEIAAWNILVMCATMFFAQGGGIVLFYLARRPMSVIMRLLCAILLVCVVFSPGINVLALTMLILLGIAENWLPLRVTKQETPGIDG